MITGRRSIRPTPPICGRTFPVSGRFTPEQRKYYDIALEAQAAALAAIKPGVMMIDVIKAAAQVLRKHGLEPFEDIERMGEDRVWGIMPSPTHYLARNAGIVGYSAAGFGVRDLGHHIGLEVQDSRDYSQPLQPGMVVTIEPKLYIPEKQLAIMIEDMILLTRDGCENLSAGTPRKAEEIEKIMAESRRRRRGTAAAPHCSLRASESDIFRRTDHAFQNIDIRAVDRTDRPCRLGLERARLARSGTTPGAGNFQ